MSLQFCNACACLPTNILPAGPFVAAGEAVLRLQRALLVLISGLAAPCAGGRVQHHYGGCVIHHAAAAHCAPRDVQPRSNKHRSMLVPCGWHVA